VEKNVSDGADSGRKKSNMWCQCTNTPIFGFGFAKYLVTATVRRLLLSTGDAAHLGAKATSMGERMTRIWAD
jgi:hypothetical protein